MDGQARRPFADADDAVLTIGSNGPRRSHRREEQDRSERDDAEDRCKVREVLWIRVH